VNELSSYAFSPLREGDIALYRGSGNGLAPILLAAAEETSLDCVERLEPEYALKGELDADWAARPVALTRYMDRMALVLEGLRCWDLCRERGPAVQHLLHHQIHWHGHGTLHLPFDHRCSRRTTMGRAKFAPRGDLSLHAAFASGEFAVIERPTSPDDLTSTEQPIVFVIDDDESMRRALTNLFQSVGLRVEVFGSAPELLRSKLREVASCLVLDIRLPGLSGLDFQLELAKANIHIPIVFMTGHGDIPMSVMAMKAGAVDFLSKPFRQQEMLDAATVAIERDRKRRKDEKIVSNARALFETLTPREREVLSLVAAGLMNKQIAAEIGIAEITVKIHRGHIMKKMGTKSLADLVRIAEMLGIRRGKP